MINLITQGYGNASTASLQTTLFDTLLGSCLDHGDRTAFIYSINSTEFEVGYSKLLDDSILLAKAFKHRKITKNSKVMLLSDNRYAWFVSDFALLSLGAVSVPRGSDTPTQELEFILTHAECEFLIIETEQLLKAHEEMLKKCKSLKAIFIMVGDRTHRWFNHTYSYNDLLKERTLTKEDKEQFIRRRYGQILDDPFTIIYTSGTTGTPKGVVLTHRNIMQNMRTLPDMIALDKDDRWVSILPSWHIFERAAEYLAISHGCCVVYSTIKTFAADLEKYRPTLVATVPRLWESMYTKINQTLERQNPRKARLFKFLVKVSSIYRRQKRIYLDQLPRFDRTFFLIRWGRKVRAALACLLLVIPAAFARKKLEAVQQKFGGRLRMAISGGGSLPFYLEEWIDAVGIRIVNAYGMTECAPAIAGRALNCHIFGTLGPATEGTELRIVDESGEEVDAGLVGEIQVRGEQVFPGYHNNDEENKKAFTDDGFFKTGDLGKLTLTGELVITGRSKKLLSWPVGKILIPAGLSRLSPSCLS